MNFGFHHSAVFDLPSEYGELTNMYWRVRNAGRNKPLRRKWYRAIRKERLRLVELGIHPERVNAVCKFLVSLKQVNADRLEIVFKSEPKQLSFNFFTN